MNQDTVHYQPQSPRSVGGLSYADIVRRTMRVRFRTAPVLTYPEMKEPTAVEAAPLEKSLKDKE
jgi:hypothetical protein